MTMKKKTHRHSAEYHDGFVRGLYACEDGTTPRATVANYRHGHRFEIWLQGYQAGRKLRSAGHP